MQTHTPAKVNLFFEVLGKRSDGFHEIISLALPIQLFDTLSFEKIERPIIQFECVGNKDIPSDDSNLVVKAVKLLQKRFQVSCGAEIKLTKRIPSQAGLGGGSSDAAAVLRLACKNWNLEVSDAELLTIASEIGSDCPIFFYETPSISTGRGEKIDSLPAVIPPLWFVLLKPPEGLSTAQVYAECMPLHDGQFRKPNDLIDALSRGDAHNIGKYLFNRLETPARKLWAQFDDVKNLLLSSGCLAVQMSGSGTAFFGLCENENHAEKIYHQLSGQSEREVFMVRSLG